jgi:type 1 glutamine amidotransferase
MGRTGIMQLAGGLAAIGMIAAIPSALNAQRPATAPGVRQTLMAAQAGGRGRGSAGPQLFTAFDANKDGSVTAAELATTFDGWYTSAAKGGAGSISEEQLAGAIDAQLGVPAAAPAGGGRGGFAGRGRAGRAGRAGGDGAPPAIVWGGPTPGLNEPCGGRSQTPTEACPKDVEAMLAAIPATAPVKPARARKVLIWSRIPSAGFQHSSIPIAAKTIEEMGKKTGAWTSDTSWDPAVFTADNLKQYDAIFLSNTTGCFLDDPSNVPLTMARRKALLDFVRGGKGLAGVHATGDSYHGGAGCVDPDAPARGGFGGFGGFGGRGGAAGPGRSLASVILRWSWGLDDHKLVANDMTLTRADLEAVSGAWFKALDSSMAGTVSQADFETRIEDLIRTQAGPTRPYVGAPGRDNGRGTWKDYDDMIGGFFKFHWYDPQHITVKIDDASSPLTAMFHGQEYGVNDEIYTFSVNSFSRKNVHVLTSLDYDKMSFTDKLKESNPRPDHDYGLSWIHRDGQGRVFYMALGHDEKIYADSTLMAHLMAGMQYALGDLKADDSPSEK